MNNLYQKYHGIPGLGIISQDGSIGNTGQNVMIGFINDFFNTTDISISTIVKAGKREHIYKKDDINNWYTYMKSLNASLNNTINSEKKLYPDTYKYNIQHNDTSYIYPDLGNSLYYTGGIDTPFSDVSDSNVDPLTFFDITDNPIESGRVFADSSCVSTLLDGSIYPDQQPVIQEFHEIFNLSNKSQNYNEIYEYVLDSSGYKTNEPKYDITIAIENIGYEPEDIAQMESMNYLDTDLLDTSYYTYLYSDYNAGIKECDISIDTDTKWLKRYIGSNEKLVMSEDLYYSKLSNTNIIYDYKSENGDIPKKQYLPILSAEDASSAKSLSKYIHIAEQLFPDGQMYKNPDFEPFVDDSGYTFMGFDMYNSSLYMSILDSDDSSDIEANFTESLNYVMNKIPTNYSILDSSKFSTDYSEIIGKFANNYQVCLQHFQQNGTGYNDVSIRWDVSAYKIIKIPTTLRSDIHEGDILYFYTDERKFAKDHVIEYMVVITKELLGCDTNKLLQNILYTEPFAYKTIYETANRIQLFNNVNILLKDLAVENPAESHENNYYMRSLSNILSYNNQNSMLFASRKILLYDDKQPYIKLFGDDTVDGIAHNIQFTIESGNPATFNHSELFNNIDLIYDINTQASIEIDDMYISNNNIFTNIETCEGIYDTKLVYYNDNYFMQPITSIAEKNNLGELGETIFKFNTYHFKQHKNMYIAKEDDYKDYIIGVYITGDLNIKTNDYEKIYPNIVSFNYETYNDYQKLILDPYEDSYILDNESDIFNTYYTGDADIIMTYSVLPYVKAKYGYIRYAYTTIFRCEIIKQGDNISSNITTSVEGDNNTFTTDVKNEYHTTLEFDGIDENELIDGACRITTDSSLIKLDNIIINGQIIDLTVDTNKKYLDVETIKEENTNKYSYKNSWLNVSIDPSSFIDICTEKTDSHTVYSLKVSDEYNIQNNLYVSINATDNIPNIMEYGSNNVNDTKKSSDYMKILNNHDGDYQKALNEYKKLFNLGDEDNNNIVECDLFYRLSNGYELPSTTDRNAKIFINYHIGDSNIQMYDEYTITQPGFSDPRTLPTVKLTMHNQIQDLELYNTLENGILCNQFQTYMDIDIDNFGYDNWGRFENDIENVTLDLEITNVKTDLQWINENNIANAYNRATIKVISNQLIDSVIEEHGYSNYISLKFDVFKDNGIPLNNLNRNEIEDCISTTKDDIDIEVSVNYQLLKNIVGESFSEDDLYKDNVTNQLYLFFTKNVAEAFKSPDDIYNGIFSDIKICLNNLKIEDTKSKYYVRILVDFGNPVITNIYLQFTVTKLQINYTPIDSITYNFTTTASSTNGLNTYLLTYDDYIQTYKFISEPLDIVINPVSYICCPTEAEKSLHYLEGSVKKIASTDNIMVKMCFYDADTYNNNILNVSKYDQKKYQKIELNKIQLKKGYLQDNVQNIVIKSLNPDDVYQYLPDTDLCYRTDYSKIQKNKKDLNIISANGYLSLVYNSFILNPKLRNDTESFYLNDKLYLKSKYDQISMKCPIFINQENKWEVRTQELLDAIDIWNFEYGAVVNKMSKEIFKGIVNTYGNGYAYLDESVDEGQYLENDILSLSDTKLLNNDTLYDKNMYFYINNASPVTIYTPNKTEYFRVPLCNVSWEFPVYCNSLNNNDEFYQVNNVIHSYKIVSPYYYLIAKLEELEGKKNPHLNYYIDNLKLSIDSFKSEVDEKNCLPYNILYDITPRISNNSDNNCINICLLRAPTICEDNDKGIHNFTDNERYYNITDVTSSNYTPVIDYPYQVNK